MCISLAKEHVFRIDSNLARTNNDYIVWSKDEFVQVFELVCDSNLFLERFFSLKGMKIKQTNQSVYVLVKPIGIIVKKNVFTPVHIAWYKNQVLTK